MTPDLEMFTQALSGARGADQERLAEVGLELVSLLLKKNADYGGSAWRRPLLAPELEPRTAMLCRMSDKLERILSLRERSPEVVSESLRDTFADLAGYLILYLAFEGEGQ